VSIDTSALVEGYRRAFPLFASKAFNIVNPSQQLVPTVAFFAMAQLLSDVIAGRVKRAIITVPPRSGKSLIASVALPAYILGQDPTRRVICASYSGELAAKFGRDCRMVMSHSSYRQIFPGTFIRGKNTEYEIETAGGGVRFSTSVGGTLTGRGGNYIIIDDPMKPDEAMSDLARERIWQWFVGTVGSRLDNKADDAIVVVMQRLHVDDLVGRLLEVGGWRHLSIPAIAEFESTVPVGPDRFVIRKRGDVLDPVREPREVLDQIKREIGTAAFEAQYLQAPVPLDGGIVKWSWFKLYREPPTRHLTDMVVQSWDTAMKAEEINDYSVGTVWQVRGKDYYLIDLVRARLAYPDLKRAVRDLAKRYNPKAVLIEDKGSGTSLIQELRWEGSLRPIAIEPIADKVTRVSTQSAKIEAGQVHLPERAAWLGDFQAEVKQFPNGKHDDQVDSMSQFLNWMDKRQRIIPASRMRGYMGR
jgi:predicted phage terminase large subunit-like protein